MEVKIDLDFRSLLKLVSQLPDEKARKLFSVLQSRLTSKKPGQKSKLKKLILEAPTWDKAQIQAVQEARDSINSSRLA